VDREKQKMTITKILHSYWQTPLTISSAFILLAMACSVGAASAQTPGPATLTVKVVGARNIKGKIGIALFQEPRGFPEDTSKAVRAQDVDITPNTMTVQVVFDGLPQGAYAVSVRHDENLNGKLDKNFIGIPKEGYGASNNPKKKLHAPTFEEAKFTLGDTAQVIEIRLIY
jgi:uncharacterized protein (DUF2141 family)